MTDLQKELQAKRNELFEHSEHTLGRIKELDKQIEAGKKPKMRVNDYGFGDGTPIIITKNRGVCFGYPFLAVDMDGVGCGVCSETESATRQLTILGNLTDDLAAMQEDVTEFRNKANEIIFNHNSSCLILRDISSGDEFYIPTSEIGIYARNLLQLHATLLRQQEAKS
jgi:hypothetical protein